MVIIYDKSFAILNHKNIIMNKLQSIKIDLQTSSLTYPHYVPPCQLKSEKSCSSNIPLENENG